MSVDEAIQSVRAQKPTKPLELGPWRGSMRSRPADQVPLDYIASVNSTTPSNNFHYLPRTGWWKRRGGSSQKFDTFGSAVGMLAAKWSSRVRHAEEFKSDAISDNIPTMCSLHTKETIASGLDDGRFGQLWLRDQVNSLDYRLGEEYDTTYTYPVVGSTQTYRFIPLWYESGDGGMTRGVNEFTRRLFLPGSRRFLKVGNWWYFPNRYGTPCRWDGLFTPSGIASGGGAGGTFGRPTTTISSGPDAGSTWSGSTVGAGGTGSSPNLASEIDETTADDGTTFVRSHGSPVTQIHKLHVNLGDTITSTTNQWTVTFRAEFDNAGNECLYGFEVYRSDGTGETTGLVFSTSTLSSSTWATLTATINFGASPSLSGTANTMKIVASAVGAAKRVKITWLSVTPGAGSGTIQAGHLIPSGPIPPTHCGSVAVGTPVSTTYMTPNADDARGSWVDQASGTSNIFNSIDEGATSSDTDYVSSNASNTTYDVGFTTPASVPSSDDTVTLRYRHRNIVASGTNSFAISIRVGSTSITSASWVFSSTSTWTNSALSLTSAQISQITGLSADWSGVYVRMTTASESGLDAERVSNLFFEIIPAAASGDGGWKGHDRFLRAFYYRFEDDSIWALTQPRFPNSTLTNGLDMVTVDSANGDLAYTFITHQNIPIGPKGVKAIGICRTDKIDSSVDDNLLLNDKGFKLIAEVPNGTTSYVDYKGDDSSLVLDAEQYFIRYDHIMPPRARHIAGGDMRVIHSYGGSNPCAIIIAPVGRTADYDLNLADTSSTLYTSNASWMQVKLTSAGVGTLILGQGDGAAAMTDTTTITLSATMTLQDLVDTINNTNCAVDGQQWRAQICPGAAPDAIALTSLSLHNRAIASCVVDNTAKTITKLTGGLSKVAVGQFITGAAEEAGAYVTRIDSDFQLTYTGTLTTTTEELNFYNSLGDAQITDPDQGTLGFQRVISNSLPGFLYFNKTYLDTQTFDKAATWMTVATPGSTKSAPNCFSGKLSNRFTPPLEAGICQGGAPCDHGFVVGYANKIGAIRPRGPDSILDRDYGLVILDESRGCAAWNTITPGNRFVPFLSAEGVFVADLNRVRLISEAIYVDAPTALGDFSYEGPQSVAAAGVDNDSSYAWIRVFRGVIWVGSRTSASTTHCDQIVRLDFSSGDEANGIEALYRSPGEVWGWGTPLIGSGSGASSIYRYNLIAQGRRSGSSAEGWHLYGFNDEHGGSTGDGRIDEIETGSTDPNSTAITGRVETPWIRPPEGMFLMGQEAVLEHNSPAASTGSLVFHRTFSDDAYTLTPGTSSLETLTELKMLPFNSARANANAVYWDYRQATGSARTLKKLVPKHKVVRRLKVS